MTTIFKVTAYFLTVDDDLVNRQGWDANEKTRAYAKATCVPNTDDVKAAFDLGCHEEAAVIDRLHGGGYQAVAEDVFVLMQNGAMPWSDSPIVECKTKFARSMSVGDVVRIEDDKGEVCWLACMSCGWEELEGMADAAVG